MYNTIIIEFNGIRSESGTRSEYDRCNAGVIPTISISDENTFNVKKFLSANNPFPPSNDSTEISLTGFTIYCDRTVKETEEEKIELTNPLSQAEFEQSLHGYETPSFKKLQEQLQTKVEEYRKLYREKFPEQFECTTPEPKFDPSALNTNNSNNNSESILRNSQSEQQKKNVSFKVDNSMVYEYDQVSFEEKDQSKKPDDDKLQCDHFL